MKAKLRNISTSQAFFILIALISMNAWSDIKSKQEIGQDAKSKAPHISSQQLSGYLTNDADFILLDIRTEAEYQAGHIKGAQWFARGRLEYYIQDLIRPQYQDCSLLSHRWQVRTRHTYIAGYGL